MNGASLCNSISLHSHSLFRFQSSSSSFATSSSSFLISSDFTTSTYVSISHRIRQSLRAVVSRRNDEFRSFAVKNRRGGGSGLMESESRFDGDEDAEEEEEDWDDFDVEAEGDGDEDEGEFLPMEKMQKWLERKPRGFGVGRKYETTIEDKLLEEIEQSWKAQAANLNKLKNDPLKSQQQLNRNDNLIKGPEETQNGFRVRVTNLPKKKNVHRDLKAAFKEVNGILNIAPAVSGNKKTKDPVCKGFAFVDFKSEIDANRFVEQFTGQRLAFGKVIKQIKCQVVDSSSNQTDSEDEYSSKGFSEEQELPFSGLELVSNADVVVVGDAFLDSWEESVDSDSDVDETEVEEDEQNHVSSSIESPIVLGHEPETDLKFQKQGVQQEIRGHVEELETPLVSFQENKREETAAELCVDDQLHRADVEDVSEENLEPINSSITSTEEQRMDRIRRLERKLLGREKLLGRGADSEQAEAKTSSRAEGHKKEKKKKKKIVVKGQAKKSSKIEIPGSSKRLKVKEKALLTGVLEKYAKVGSTSND